MGKKGEKFVMARTDADAEELAVLDAANKDAGIFPRGEQLVEYIDYLIHEVGDTVYLRFTSEPRREDVPSATQRSRQDNTAWVCDVVDMRTDKEHVYIVGQVLYNSLREVLASGIKGAELEILKLPKEGKRYAVFQVWDIAKPSKKK